MPLARVCMLVKNPTREITTKFAGCRDDEDAEAKARSCYDVHLIKWIEWPEGQAELLIEEPKQKPVAGGIEM